MNKKKIKKFLQHPLRFFADSRYISPAKLSVYRYENIFVISTLNQWFLMEKFIIKYALENVAVIVLYTQRNLSLLRFVEKMNFNKDEKLYLKLELPLYPLQKTLPNLLYLHRCYKRVLRLFNIQNLYVFSMRDHYRILLNFARKQQVKLHLLEEGTALYVPVCDRKLKYFKHFDNVYASFPILLATHFPKSNIEYYFPYQDSNNIYDRTQAKNIRITYDIGNDDILFISQKFAGDDLYYDTLLAIMERISKSKRVFVVLHPQEQRIDRIKERFLGVVGDNIKILELSNISLEMFVKFANISTVVGITSTALVYAKLLNANLRVFSVAELLLSELDSSSVSFRLIKEHSPILKLWSDDVSSFHFGVQL